MTSARVSGLGDVSGESKCSFAVTNDFELGARESLTFRDSVGLTTATGMGARISDASSGLSLELSLSFAVGKVSALPIVDVEATSFVS